jgi:hypothetical protein
MRRFATRTEVSIMLCVVSMALLFFGHPPRPSLEDWVIWERVLFTLGVLTAIWAFRLHARAREEQRLRDALRSRACEDEKVHGELSRPPSEED